MVRELDLQTYLPDPNSIKEIALDVGRAVQGMDEQSIGIAVQSVVKQGRTGQGKAG